MVIDWSGKRVLVTGSSSGIGAELAVEFARRGAAVGICGRRRDRLDQVLERIRELSPGSCRWVVDLADPEGVDRLAASAIDELGAVDVLVNNAGIPRRQHVTALSPDTVESVMAINFLSPVRLTLALLPHLLERSGAFIVNVASVAATLSSPGEAAYDASKAALATFSEAMAVDLWQTGVRVLTVYPGLVDTELLDQPDNDPVKAAIPMIPVETLVDGVFEALDADSRQVYVPAYFGALASRKARDVEAFLAATAEYITGAGHG